MSDYLNILHFFKVYGICQTDHDHDDKYVRKTLSIHVNIYQNFERMAGIDMKLISRPIDERALIFFRPLG